MKVEWSLRAVGHLDAIHDYIAGDSPSAALRFVNRLVEAPERLETFPDSGREVPELPGLRLREVIHEGYRLIYRTHAGRIEVVAVVHGSRDLGRLSLSE